MLFIDIWCIWVVQPPHSLSTVKMPVPPTPSFYKLKWILHSAKLSTLKCMVEGHLAPSYCRQPLPLSSSKVSPLFQREPFSQFCCQTPSLLLLSLWQMLIPSCVCGFTDIWIAAQGSTWLLMSTCSVCEYLSVHSPTHTHTEAIGGWQDVFLYYSPTLFFEAGPLWAWSPQLLIGCLASKLLVFTR